MADLSRIDCHARNRRYATPSHLIVWNTTADAFRIGASLVIAATMCCTTPKVHPNAASTPAFAPRERLAAMENTAPVPGVTTTTNVVRRRATLV
jgi:hypothetical protein